MRRRRNEVGREHGGLPAGLDEHDLIAADIEAREIIRPDEWPVAIFVERDVVRATRVRRQLLDELAYRYDHIVIDTPPTLSVTDAVVLSTKADAVVLVIRSGVTTKGALRRSRDILMQVNAKVTGVLLNAVDLNSPDYYYYYEYQGKYSSRYYQEDELAEDKDGALTASSTSA